MKPFAGTQTKAEVDKEQVTDVLDRALNTVKGLDAKGKDLAKLQAQLAALLGPETAAEAKGTTTTPAPSTTPAEPAADAKKAEDAAKAADAEKAETTAPATTTGASR
jgi:peptidoglycan hydrolase CwlO-like protein